jgi:hypothetical protein
MTTLRLADRPTAVYRLFSKNDELLYVGCSCEPDRRLMYHRYKPWGPDIADVVDAWFPDRLTALRQEARAITEESPLHNISRPSPDRIRATKPAAELSMSMSGLTFEQAAEEVDVPVDWLRDGVADGKLPHSCEDPDDVWFTPDDIRDLHIIYDLPPRGLERQRIAARASVRRDLRFKRCSHPDEHLLRPVRRMRLTAA